MIILGSISISETVDVTPNTNRMFMIFDPIMLPILSSDWPFRAAVTEATISGILVPNATTVRPITCSLILKLRAKSEAPLIKRPAP